jgi:hypothetical protein
MLSITFLSYSIFTPSRLKVNVSEFLFCPDFYVKFLKVILKLIRHYHFVSRNIIWLEVSVKSVNIL